MRGFSLGGKLIPANSVGFSGFAENVVSTYRVHCFEHLDGPDCAGRTFGLNLQLDP